MHLLFLLIIFFFGLSVGSFLNVIIDRLKRNESLRGRSYCDSCRHQLSLLDLIPLLSFFILKRRCRYCRSPISWQYPLVEFATGLLFAISAIYFFSGSFPSPLTVLYFLLSLYYLSTLIVIFIYDFKSGIIPDQIVLPAILVAILSESFFGFLNFSVPHFLSPLILGFIIGSFFLMIFLVSKGKGMGGGDVKLAFLMGIILSWQKVLVALYLAFLLGAMVSLLLIIFGKKGFKSTIPFGPFLVMGTVVAMFWGEEIFRLYTQLC